MRILIGIVLIVIGVLGVVKPEFMSMFGERWKYKNAEPSELNIGITVISGIVWVIFGVVYMFTDF